MIIKYIIFIYFYLKYLWIFNKITFISYLMTLGLFYIKDKNFSKLTSIFNSSISYNISAKASSKLADAFDKSILLGQITPS